MKFSRIVPPVGGIKVPAGSTVRLNKDQFDRRIATRAIKLDREDRSTGLYYCNVESELFFKAGDAVEVSE